MYDLQEFLNETILYISYPQNNTSEFYNFFSLDYQNICNGIDYKEYYSINRLLIKFNENHRRLGFLLQKKNRDFDINSFYLKNLSETRPIWFKKLQLPDEETNQKISEGPKGWKLLINSQGSRNIDFWITSNLTIRHWLQGFLYNLYVKKLS